MNGKSFLFFLLILAISSTLYPQTETAAVNIDYNEKYKFPVSFGGEYLGLAPAQVLGTDYGGEFQVSDIHAAVKFPIQKMPVLQPFVQIGMISVICIDRLELDILEKFNHNHFYLLGGLGYMNKISRQFELGVDLGAGLSQSVFDQLAEVPVGSFNLITGAGARVVLNISHNVSLEINPALKYIKTFGPLTRFDGVSLGVGFAGHYRLGEDPDAPQAAVRSIKFLEARIPPIFAAMQSYYVKNPVGLVTIQNTEKFPITDVYIAFMQAGYMDTQTKAISIPGLGPGKTMDVELFATFNHQIFYTEGITPLTGEVVIDYNARGRISSQSFPVTYDLYDKEALTWDDDKKVAAFITPADSAVRNYTSFIRQACRDAVFSSLSSQFQTGIQVFYALKEFGCLYQKDPTSSFESAYGKTEVVDAVSLPRNTLKRATGDCDDLTVLYCSLLESVGIETGFITIPGHIYSAFNTGIAAKSYKLLHPEKRMTLNIDGELWVPVEITQVGQGDFSAAWRMGIEEFEQHADNPEVRNLYRTRIAQEIYRPVVLKETDLGLQYGDRSVILKDFSTEITRIANAIVDDYETIAKTKQKKSNYNRYGIIAARLEMYDRAEKAFNTALSYDRNYLSAKLNLGNLFYMKQEYLNALRTLHNTEEELIKQGLENSKNYSLVLLNISRSYYELENYDKSAIYLDKLTGIAPEMANQYAYLTSSDGDSRAADLGGMNTIMFADEE